MLDFDWTLTLGDLAEPASTLVLAVAGYWYLDRGPRKRAAAHELMLRLLSDCETSANEAAASFQVAGDLVRSRCATSNIHFRSASNALTAVMNLAEEKKLFGSHCEALAARVEGVRKVLRDLRDAVGAVPGFGGDAQALVVSAEAAMSVLAKKRAVGLAINALRAALIVTL